MTLTPRQTAVLYGIAAGLSSKEIAARMGISHKTVEAHRAQMALKVGDGQNPVKVLRLAVQNHLLPDNVLAIPAEELLSFMDSLND